MSNIRASLPIIVAAITCPCHLPLLAVLLAGTALGGFITANLTGLAVASSIAFVSALFLWRRQVQPPTQSPELTEAEKDLAIEGTSTGPPLKLQILRTSGCASCAGVERSWEKLRRAYDRLVKVEFVDLLEQPELAAQYGVLRSPAIVLDDQLVVQGPVNARRIQQLIEDALRQRVTSASARGSQS